jgi:hypothetical protein
MITHHGQIRQQQRGLPRLVLDWLAAYGREVHDHRRRAVIRHFTPDARRRLERDIGREPVRRMHEYLDAYAVYDTDGTVITVGHRYERIRRDLSRRDALPPTMHHA